MASTIHISLDELGRLVERAGQRQVDENDWPILLELLDRYYQQQKNRWERRLAQLEEEALAPSLPGQGPKSAPGSRKKQEKEAKEKAPGHGKRAADDYEGATHIHYELGDFHNGQSCPFCHKGRMYQEREGRMIRIVGQASLHAQVHHIQKARCRLCGAKREADYPKEQLSAHISGFNYKACALLIITHYLGGLPFKRLELLQSWLSQKIPDARQWDVIDQVDDELLPVYRAHEREQIDEAFSVRFDDTGARINSLGHKDSGERAVNASVFYFEGQGFRGVLVYTGAHHAGEVFSHLMTRRSPDKAPLVKTVDGASKNFCHEEKERVVASVCNSHAYRKFKDQRENHPEEYDYVKGIYEQVYEHDAYCKKRHLSPQARLAYHQEYSTELMERLRNWAIEKIKNGHIELNSKLSEAIGYLSNQWRRLTEFLRTPGVPLDTNLAEQVVKIIIRYRNNSRAYKNELGAQVGDRMMALAYSVALAGLSPIDYFEWCLENRGQLKDHPERFTPQAYAKDRASPGASSLANTG